MYIKLKDIDHRLLERISVLTSSRVYIKYIDSDFVIEKDDLFDVLSEITTQYEQIKEEFEYYKDDVKDNFIRVQERDYENE